MMSLLRKVRTLIGALAHKPLAPRPDKIPLDNPEDARQDWGTGADRSGLSAAQPPLEDAERVADLIAQKRRNGADQAGSPRAR